ncbi:MAG: lactonase family protein [Chitinophagaceae bacterium]
MFTKNSNQLFTAMAIAVAITFASCSKEANKTNQTIQQPVQTETSLRNMISENGNNPDENMLSQESLSKGSQGGYVYTESNDASWNQILVYNQHSDGSLSWNSSVVSGGAGSGSGLGSQGALVLDYQHQWLYAVNAGDNSISSFWVHSDGSLTLAHTINSGGTKPISLSVWGNLLYVVNSTSANICGFYIGANGALSKINGSWQPLSSSSATPAQISFHPNGKILFITEKGTNKIDAFKLNASGVAGAGNFNNSVGATPFGFNFAYNNNNYLVVSNAAGGAANAGSCTSYSTDNWGSINAINGTVPNYQSAPCWVATAHYGRFAFISNTASNTISSYYISPFGAIYLVFFTIAKTDESPIDITVSGNNHFVYNINSTSHTITEYQRSFFGILNRIGKVNNVPAYASGLAAY